MREYLKVLRHILSQPQSFQSNHFRNHADVYAEAASRNHITCLDIGFNTGRWKLTSKGHSFLEENTHGQINCFE